MSATTLGLRSEVVTKFSFLRPAAMASAPTVRRAGLET